MTNNSTIKMKLYPKYFKQIVSGQKHLEIRLYDEKRKKIGLGTKIIFSDYMNGKNKICVKVIKYKILNNRMVLDALTEGEVYDDDELYIIKVAKQLYSVEQLEKYEIIAIYFQRI